MSREKRWLQLIWVQQPIREKRKRECRGDGDVRGEKVREAENEDRGGGEWRGSEIKTERLLTQRATLSAIWCCRIRADSQVVMRVAVGPPPPVSSHRGPPSACNNKIGPLSLEDDKANKPA